MCQFSWFCDGANDTPRNAHAWVQANQIASLALSSELPDLVGGATHYHATYVYPGWASSLEPVATIGRHRFYK